MTIGTQKSKIFLSIVETNSILVINMKNQFFIVPNRALTTFFAFILTTDL